MGAAYSFVTRWDVTASAAACWESLERMLHPAPGATTWWPSLEVVEPPARAGVGEPLTIQVRSPLGYRLRTHLTITEYEPPRSIAAASTGDLHGRGRIVVEGDDAHGTVTIHWDVSTERAWMNATAWLLRPLFERAHEHVMQQGEQGLRRELGDPREAAGG